MNFGDAFDSEFGEMVKLRLGGRDIRAPLFPRFDKNRQTRSPHQILGGGTGKAILTDL
jgi:hypothetical protein